jgi:hypothetical protein
MVNYEVVDRGGSLQMWRCISMNIISKQSQIAKKGWYASLGLL